ncbi:hypothetical protein LXL04_002567 [Taraxacum kok-saghyz]
MSSQPSLLQNESNATVTLFSGIQSGIMSHFMGVAIAPFCCSAYTSISSISASSFGLSLPPPPPRGPPRQNFGFAEEISPQGVS